MLLQLIRQSERRLTPRESEIVELAYLQNADIAQLLGISRRTVQATLANAYRKLGAENRTSAMLLWQGRKAA
jgi:DNA-binding CsgD family transcriptional regulator